MDLATLTMAKKYTDSQRLAYASYETTDTIGFDGEIADKATFPGEILETSGTYVHVSDRVFDGGYARTAHIKTAGGLIYSTTNLRVDKADDDTWLLFGTAFSTERLLALSFVSSTAEQLGIPAGTYVWTGEITGTYCYLHSVYGYFTETIHPIDPKFLPGVCLPVVEVTSAPYSFEEGNIVSLTAEESARFNAAVGASDFVLIKIRLNGEIDLYDAFVACCIHVDGVAVLNHTFTTDLRLVFFGPDPETGLWVMGG